jgi:hypothetical protein
MTKFVGEAIGVRAKAKGYSAKERAKDMEKFKETVGDGLSATNFA